VQKSSESAEDDLIQSLQYIKWLDTGKSLWLITV